MLDEKLGEMLGRLTGALLVYSEVQLGILIISLDEKCFENIYCSLPLYSLDLLLLCLLFLQYLNLL